MKRCILFSVLGFLFCFSGYSQNFQWAKQHSNALDGTKVAAGNNLVATVGVFHNSITIGSQTFTSPDSLSFYLSVYSPGGQNLWAKQIISSPYNSQDNHNVTVDQNDNVIISGIYYDSLYIDGLLFKGTPSNPGGLFVVKFNSSGTLLWAQRSLAYFNAMSAYNAPPKVSTDAAGNIYLTGTFDGIIKFGTDSLFIPNNFRPFIAKFNTTGTLMWLKNPGNYSVAWTTICSISNGNFYFAATYHGTQQTGGAYQWMIIKKYDATGSEIWTRYGNSVRAPWKLSLVVDARDNAYLTGETLDSISFSNLGAGAIDLAGGKIFLAKINPAGTWKWARNIVSGNFYSGMNQLSFRAPNKLAFAGVYQDSISVDGAQFMAPTAGTFHSYVADFDTSGFANWAFTRQMYNTGLAADPAGNLYTSGQFENTVAFGGTTLLTTSPSGAGYLAKLNAINLSAGYDIKGNINSLQVYPNPVAAQAFISYNLPKHFQKAQIVIREIATGQEIRKYELKNQQGNLTVDVSQLQNGLYLYSLVVDEKPVATKKLAVMK